MKKTLSTLTVTAASLLLLAAPLRAQTPASAEDTYFLNVSAGGQLQTSTFGSSSTFSSFGETGQVESTQNVGRAFVADISGGYFVSNRFGVGLGIWGGRADSAAAATVLVPDPLFFNRYTTVNLNTPDLMQTMFGVNFQILIRQPITDSLDLTFSAGPSVIHVKQEIASASVTPNTTSASLNVLEEKKTTAKAGNVGVDVAYRFGETYGIGGFVRYVGGQSGLPSAADLKIGGVQVGGGLRLRF
ncbi:MAG: outer membrane beta-barrel protein [Vicinamibacterales bacterium]